MNGWIERRVNKAGKASYRARWYGVPHPGTGRRAKESSTHPSKASAQKALRAALTAIDNGTAAARDDQRFGELCELWLAALPARLSPVTRGHYAWLLKRYILPALEKKAAQAIEPVRLQRLLSTLRQTPAVHLHCHQLLARIFAFGMKMRLLGSNPMESLERPRVERGEVTAWSLEEARHFAAVAMRDERLGPLWLVYLELGCRRGEGLGLRWTDIDLERKTIAIRSAVVLAAGKVTIKSTKNRRSRTLEASPELLAELKRWRAVVNARRLRSRELWEEHGLVFGDELGRPLDPGSLRSQFRRLCREASVPVVRIHAMRHTAATLMVERGAPLPAVSKRLGHARISTTTDFYGRSSPRMEDAAAEAIQRALYG